MPKITLELTDARYAALSKTQALMALAGGPAKTPEEYLLLVVNGACDSYAAQYADDTPEGMAAQLAIAQEAKARAEAQAAEADRKRAEAEAKVAKPGAGEGESTPLYQQLENL